MLNLIHFAYLFCVITLAFCGDDNRFTESTPKSQSNPLIWMIMNQLNKLDIKEDKLQNSYVKVIEKTYKI